MQQQIGKERPWLMILLYFVGVGMLAVLCGNCKSKQEERGSIYPTMAFEHEDYTSECDYIDDFATSVKYLETVFFHIDATFKGNRFNGPEHLKQFFIDHNNWVRPGYFIWIDSIGIAHPLWQVNIDNKIEYSEVTNGVKGHNRTSMHIAFSSAIPRNDKYKSGLNELQLLTALNLVKVIKNAVPSVQFKGHRDASPDTNGNGKVDKSEWIKTCPNFDVCEWLGENNIDCS